MSLPKKRHPRLRQEIAAVCSLFFAVFFLLCLISYSLPLLSVEPGLQHPADNWCGAFGYYVAYYLFSFLGLTAFFPVLILGYTSCTALLPGASINRLPFIIAGITGMLIAASGLLATTRQLVFPEAFIVPGGYLGTLVWTLSGSLMGNVGSVLLLLLLLTFSLMAAVRFSPLGTGKWLWRKSGEVKSKLPKKVPVPKKKTRKTDREPVVTAASTHEHVVQQEMPAVHEPVKNEPPGASEEKEFSLRPLKSGEYCLPPLSLLDQNAHNEVEVNREYYYKVSKILIDKLEDFGVQGTVQGISPGPVVTTYEYAPAPGVKINKIVSLADDLAMALKVDRVRVVGSIPGKAALGIEIPNPVRNTVFINDILFTEEYRDAHSFLSLALGFDVIGRPIIADLDKMPHLLIAGATGAGKSVAINAFISSILFKATPEDVRLLLIDPKRIELSVYEDIPHLLHPVVVEPKMASRALMWAVREMERRYRLLEEMRVKSIYSYNEVAEEKLPYIVIIVDELADLMMVASKDVETSIARLAQMARAAGMHIMLATQRPSVDVLTGLIKANFPT
ncbi:MAG: cell division protein FtsK, partial [Desulfobulbaceae bacterium]|nr:cell division protein FtsK [Desulfobulbaceae bacterium]